MIFHRYWWRMPQWVYSDRSNFDFNFHTNILNKLVGVIVDHEYLGQEYESTLELMKQIIERVIREDLRGAGLSIKYYSWSRINFNKGTKSQST